MMVKPRSLRAVHVAFALLCLSALAVCARADDDSDTVDLTDFESCRHFAVSGEGLNRNVPALTGTPPWIDSFHDGWLTHNPADTAFMMSSLNVMGERAMATTPINAVIPQVYCGRNTTVNLTVYVNLDFAQLPTFTPIPFFEISQVNDRLTSGNVNLYSDFYEHNAPRHGGPVHFYKAKRALSCGAVRSWLTSYNVAILAEQPGGTNPNGFPLSLFARVGANMWELVCFGP